MTYKKYKIILIVGLIFITIITTLICVLITQKNYTEWMPKRRAYQIKRTMEELDQNIVIEIKDKE